MQPAQLAACLNAYHMDLKPALQRAAQDGFRAAQPDFSRIPLDDFGLSAQRALKKYVRDVGLVLPVLGVEYDGAGLADAQRAGERLEQFRRTAELARRLETPAVEVTVGGLDKTGLASEMLEAVAEWSDRLGVTVIVRGGGASAGDVLDRVKALNCRTVRAAVDTLQGLPGVDLSQVADVRLLDARAVGAARVAAALVTGDVDVSAALRTLRNERYGGLLTLHEDRQWAGVDGMRRARQYVQSAMSAG